MMPYPRNKRLSPRNTIAISPEHNCHLPGTQWPSPRNTITISPECNYHLSLPGTPQHSTMMKPTQLFFMIILWSCEISVPKPTHEISHFFTWLWSWNNMPSQKYIMGNEQGYIAEFLVAFFLRPSRVTAGHCTDTKTRIDWQDDSMIIMTASAGEVNIANRRCQGDKQTF